METRKVKLSNGKEYEAKEIKYKELVACASLDKELASKFLLQKATQLTDEEYEELGMKDGILLQTAVNDLNGLTESFLQTAP